MAAGFQDGLGNISLPKLNSFPWNVDSVTSSVKAPAMGRTERAEMNAESEYMALEVDDFEPHAIAVSEHECESTGEHVVDGDAPAAGDGLQVAGEGEQPQSKMLRRDRPAAADF